MPFRLVLACAAFVSIGLADGLLGVGWPHMRIDLDQPLAAVGYLLFVVTAAYLLSSAATGFLISRLGVGWLLVGGTVISATGLLGYAVSPRLAAVMAAAWFLGFGAGAVDAGLNAYAATHFGARHMTWMHAHYGLGAMLGPLVMTTALTAGWTWRWGYGTVALAQAALAVMFLVTIGSWAASRPTAAATAADASPATEPIRAAEPVRVWQTLSLPAVWRGAAAFGVYVAIEVGAGLWAYTLLTTGRGMPAAVAGPAVSVYYGCLFVGRLVFGVVAERLGAHRVLVGAMVGLATGAWLLAVPAPGAVAVGGLALLGLAAAPVFPLMMLTTGDRVGRQHLNRTVGLQVAVAGLGGASLTSGLGLLADRLGIGVVGPVLLLFVAGLALLYFWPWLRRRGTAGRRPRLETGGGPAAPPRPGHP